MKVVDFLAELNPLDEVNVFAETVVGLQPLYSGIVRSIERGVMRNWADSSIMGVWVYRRKINVVISDMPNYWRIPARIAKIIRRVQSRIKPRISGKRYW